MPEERYVKLVNGEEFEMSAEEIAERQAEELLFTEPPIRLADALCNFLFQNLDANLEIIDAFTELRIRQLQKSLEAIPDEMSDIRFAQGVRPIIASFEIPDIPELAQIKQAMLDQIDAVIAAQGE